MSPIVPASRTWEPLPGESSKAYKMFLVYRDLGPSRSQVDAWRSCTGRPPRAEVNSENAPGHVKAWGTEHSWVQRAKDWDAHIARETEIGTIEGIRAMKQGNFAAALKLQQVALAALEGLKPGDITPGEITRMLVEAAKMMNKAHGEADVTVELSPQFYFPVSD